MSPSNLLDATDLFAAAAAVIGIAGAATAAAAWLLVSGQRSTMRELENTIYRYQRGNVHIQEGRYVDTPSREYVDQIEYLSARLNSRLERIMEFQERSILSGNSEAIGVISNAVESAVTKKIAESLRQPNLALTAADLSQQVSLPISQFASRESIAREISHALLTPLSRIDAIARTISVGDNETGLAQELNQVRSAVQICYIYLSAFRVTAYEPAQGVVDLNNSIRSACDVFIRQHQRLVSVNIEAPSITAYVADYYLLACALPLIENAIEASFDGDQVEILVEENDELTRFSISNALRSQIDLDQIFTSGYTTKTNSGTHEGLGLAICRNLVSALPGAKVEGRVTPGNVTFEIRVPRG